MWLPRPESNSGVRDRHQQGEKAELDVKILVVDIGGTSVKMLVSGEKTRRKFPSGPDLTPQRMAEEVLAATKDWEYEAVAVGFPGPILCGQPMTEPVNLGIGWMSFDFGAAFHLPVRVINDAAMQALGSYQGGKMLFVGLGTGIGTAVVLNGEVEALEIGRFRYKKHAIEHYLGKKGLKRLGEKRWQREVKNVVGRLITALKPDDVVIGGGNVKYLTELPEGCRAGSNANAFIGGFRLWESEKQSPKPFSSEPVQVVRPVAS
jgi:polyphosphate glucokinase